MATLAELVARLERLQGEPARARLSSRLATETRKLIDTTFVKQASPYAAWRARKGVYAWPLLQKSGNLRAGWVLAQCDASGFRFTNVEPYAAAQFYGGRGIYPRRMFPTEAFGLPDSWRSVYARAIADELRKLLSR